MIRCKHKKYGLGVVLEEFTSNGGKQSARVIFDANPEEERVILLSFLSESTAKLPTKAKKAKTRMPGVKKEKSERISDGLLVPELDEGSRIVPDFASGFESGTGKVHE